jgi:uncharacterized membrane protein YphA (DoxX/SURF4 family)
MTAAATVLRLVLALVFGAAGTAKMLDRTGTQEALAAFGVPRSLAASASVLLPVVELVVAGVEDDQEHESACGCPARVGARQLVNRRS